MSFPYIIARAVNLLINGFHRIREINRICLHNHYDLVFVPNTILDGLAAAYVRRRYGIPFVFALSSPLEQYWAPTVIEPPRPKFLYFLIAKCHRLIAYWLMRKANLVLPSSKWLKKKLAKEGIQDSKMMSYPNGVELDVYMAGDGARVRKKYRLENQKVLLYVGSLAKPRGMLLLIEAFKKVKEERNNVKLLLLGSGNDADNLKNLAVNLGVKDDVIFTGQVPQTEVPDFIMASDIGICPVPPFYFYTLSCPIKMLEYMALGKPVVANEEIFEQQEVLQKSRAGILTPYIAEAFAAAVVDLLDSSEKCLEMSRRGKEWVKANRTYDILARRLEERYFDMLKGRKALYSSG
jgi:glycosyltransferase involved in cell wall biosynthesis